MGINSQTALDAINASLPMAEDMIEAMAMSLWQSLGSLLDAKRYDNGAGFHDIPAYLQDDLRDAARLQAGFVVATLDPAADADVIEDRLLEIDEYLTACEYDAADDEGHVDDEIEQVTA